MYETKDSSIWTISVKFGSHKLCRIQMMQQTAICGVVCIETTTVDLQFWGCNIHVIFKNTKQNISKQILFCENAHASVTIVHVTKFIMQVCKRRQFLGRFFHLNVIFLGWQSIENDAGRSDNKLDRDL